MAEIINGLVSNAKVFASPNVNKRPAGAKVSLLVIHNISLPANVYSGSCVHDLFMNQLDCQQHPSFDSLDGVKVSSHLFIRRNGEIQQYVNLDERAWHAGESSFRGENNCNDFSIGIELEGSDHIAYAAAQYQSLVEISAVILAAYPDITPEAIVGHNDIAPARKSDPGAAFDWQWYRRKLLENIGVE